MFDTLLRTTVISYTMVAPILIPVIYFIKAEPAIRRPILFLLTTISIGFCIGIITPFALMILLCLVTIAEFAALIGAFLAAPFVFIALWFLSRFIAKRCL